MARRGIAVLVLAGILSLAARPALAAPAAIEVPVSVKLTATVPGTYVLRFELSGADRAVRWAEQMDPAGDGRRVTTPTLHHLLGSLWRTVPGNTALDPSLFSEQLWLQALRWSAPRRTWAAASARVKLTVVPYAAWSAVSDAAGEETITTFMIQDGAVTGEKIQDGAVSLRKIGESCPADKPQLVYGPEGWACGTALTCQPGDFLMCYDPALFDRLFVGVCRPGYRPCNAQGSGFGPCAGAVLPAADACNGLDEDCDGIVDNPLEAAGGVRLHEDADRDAHGKDAVSRTFCGADHPGWAPVGGDCDDADPAVFTGAPEFCDSKDNDCNGAIDDDCRIPGACTEAEQGAIVACIQQCAGAGSPLAAAECARQCAAEANLSAACDDAAGLFAGCYIVNDCDTESFDPACALAQCAAFYGDVFGHLPDCAYGATRPCGDTPNRGECHQGTEACLNGRWSGACAGAVFPAVEYCDDQLDTDCDGNASNPVAEICDGRDNDCAGGADNAVEGVVHCVVPPGAPCTAADGNALDECLAGLAAADQIDQCFQNLSPACQQGLGETEPGLPACIFDRCLLALEPLALDPACFDDAGLCKEPYDLLLVGRPGECLHGGAPRQCGPDTAVGVCEFGTQACDHGLWGTCQGAVLPSLEVCGDGLDNDCDGPVDEGSLQYLDEDGDGFGAGDPVLQCALDGWTDQGGDCDDTDAMAFPGNEEVACDGRDNDCDPGTPDRPDQDGDGYVLCAVPGGGDCDDGDPSINPGAPELCDPDFADENCDGQGNEGCECVDGEQQECYTGPPATAWVGECRPGTMACAAGAWGPCDGEVVPESEACDGRDNDCDGMVDEEEGAPLCDDGVACTVNLCQGPGGCVNLLDDAACDDGSYCTGQETCDGALGCLPGTPPACDDGDVCTIDACDDLLQSCTWTPTPLCP